MRVIRTLLLSLLQLSHRYIGIPLGFMFTVWFVSAFFMIYTGGMPRITPDQRVDGMEAIDFSRVRLDLATALERGGFDSTYLPATASLRSLLGRPVYVLGEPGYDAVQVAADTGVLIGELTPQQGLLLASAFLDIAPERFRFTHTLDEADQWTLSNLRDLPLFHYEVDDGLGTEVYVSPRAAQVSVYTTRMSRTLAWLGTIPHWLYFAELRQNQPLWYRLVVYLSYAGCAVAVLGLALGVLQWRRVRPFSLARAIPYRGWYRWHYMLGALFGVFILTWVFSGLVSMEPWDWTNARGLRVAPDLFQDELRPERFPRPATVDWSAVPGGEVKQVEFRAAMGEPWLIAGYSVPRDAGSSKRDRLHQPYNVNGQSAAATVVMHAATGQVQQGFASSELLGRIEAGVTAARVSDHALLDRYDDYYYSRQGQLPLPVLRVKFDDPAATWLYLDPVRAEPLALVHKYSRIERWLYSGLHSLDFAFWYHKRPLWDIGVILLLCGGLATSLLGLWLGLRRLGRDLFSLLRRGKRGVSGEGVEHASS